jgi:hypothetical protein
MFVLEEIIARHGMFTRMQAKRRYLNMHKAIAFFKQ